jgi:hypothetical protein
MIWFGCKKCGKRHGRAENLAGTMIFCECGHGNRVPWMSTAPEPEAPAQPVPPRARVPAPAEPEERRPPEPPLPSRRPARPFRKVRPESCFNHDEQASSAVCAECRLHFCPACVVTLRGRTLCGPCKNFLIRGSSCPARVLPLAVLALVVCLVSGPVTLILTLLAIGLQASEGVTGGAVLLCLVSLVLPGAGLVLAGMALKQIEVRPQTGGRGLATGGAAAAAAGVLWAVTVAVVAVCKVWQG